MGDELLCSGTSLWLGSAVLSTWLGSYKGHLANGFLAGVFFGPLGLLAVAFMPMSPRATAKRNLLIEREREHLRLEAKSRADRAEFKQFRRAEAAETETAERLTTASEAASRDLHTEIGRLAAESATAHRKRRAAGARALKARGDADALARLCRPLSDDDVARDVAANVDRKPRPARD